MFCFASSLGLLFDKRFFTNSLFNTLLLIFNSLIVIQYNENSDNCDVYAKVTLY